MDTSMLYAGILSIVDERKAMYVVTDADRKNADELGKVHERFYFRHEAYDYTLTKRQEGVDGIVLFEEDHWVSSEDQTFLYGPYSDSDTVSWRIRELSEDNPDTHYHEYIELNRVH